MTDQNNLALQQSDRSREVGNAIGTRNIIRLGFLKHSIHVIRGYNQFVVGNNVPEPFNDFLDQKMEW